MSRKKKVEISCVDLFCGAGGLTYGLSKAGITVTTGIDLDPVCRFPYEENNRGSRFIERNVAKLSAEEVEGFFAPGSIKVLAGCAPCQPFSTYSQRYDTVSDGRWALLEKFGYLVKEIAPDIVTMENVPAIRQHKVFKHFLRILEDMKYHVWHDVVECANYGVPQKRKRTVLLASRLGPISFIEKTAKKPRTVRDEIGGLNPLRAGQQDINDPLHFAASLSETNLARIRVSKPGGTWRDWPKGLIAKCHTKVSGKTYPGVYGRMEWDKSAPTMTTQCYGFGNGRFGHPKQNRAISLREAAMLQSFPKAYRFVPKDKKVPFKSIGRLIGNAVPVKLGVAIGKSISEHIASTIK